MTSTLYDEALTWFQTRESEAYQAYQDSIDAMVSDDTDLLEAWHAAADMRHSWLNAHDDAVTAFNAVPCKHTLAERSCEAQRCAHCWTLSTYSRLTTPKENGDD